MTSCCYCNNIFSSQKSLISHLKHAKYCIKIRRLFKQNVKIYESKDEENIEEKDIDGWGQDVDEEENAEEKENEEIVEIPSPEEYLYPFKSEIISILNDFVSIDIAKIIVYHSIKFLDPRIENTVAIVECSPFDLFRDRFFPMNKR